MLNIKKESNESSLTVFLEGRLDTITAPELEKSLQESIEGVKSLTFDFGNLEYISSAGLRVILAAQKLMTGKGEMKVCNLNETAKEIFEVTGFSDILTIE